MLFNNVVGPIGLVLLTFGVSQDQPDLLSRLFLAAALALVSFPCMAACSAGWSTAKGLARALDIHRWLFVWLTAAFLVALSSITQWTGPDITISDIRRPAVAGAVIGALVAFLLPNQTIRYQRYFDTSSSAASSVLGRFVAYGWPFAATAIILGVALDPPDAGWNGIYPIFQMAFLPFLVMLFPLRGTIRGSWETHVPRLGGYVLLICALIVS